MPASPARSAAGAVRAMTLYVAYIRLDDEDRGQPETTLAAQERSIRFFLEECAGPQAGVIGSFRDDHPEGDGTQWRQALALCRECSAELLVARLDRLPPAPATRAAILADPTIGLRVATLPDATRAELSIHARLLEQERAIHARQALRALDRRAERGLHRQCRAPGKAAAAPAEAATPVPDQVARIVLPMRQRGATLRDIAEVLNRTGLVTISGTAWRPAQVSRILQLMQ